MHGLINRAIQGFVTDSYGEQKWSEVAKHAQLSFDGFEAMLTYEDELTPQVLSAVYKVLDRPCADILEDLGTYLVSHPNTEAVRRLLRFGGVNLVDFLHSLDDLPGRARLAVPDLHLPKIELREHTSRNYSLTCHSTIEGYGHVMIGILRTMADDYGALVLLEHQDSHSGFETIAITLVETEFAEGRSFELGTHVS